MYKKILVILFLVLSGCTQQKMLSINDFVGDWDCQEYPLNDNETYTGYLALTIAKDGTFSLYDQEAGNPGISGEMELLSLQEMKLLCDENEDFDPPQNWLDISYEQVFQYQFISNEELHITYQNNDYSSTLVFVKE